ncbi:MAG: Fe-S cluster assembly scaffold SufA [Roseibium album]|uniref:Iron-sulfur cluster assembly protein n=1 Tax=Roseibium album TaxID=311410 RepID=A0A0M7AU23_9HYPH|nr:Fe-S cluster assembly scaffold SufA [Roseibium album]MBG6143817.1 iron-sulfur cluster assembly protein [Labrenzia sp. EL_142]MBG6163917.1 iron-sulfur cluster assembly protein [Labrenzia sp. EL_195]MBG6176921.1 iron-sulfur cluster assembly protein [Labrenzia sp. EL_132]MBG6200413.1 iron-sulfur cluster assembly protein [Labrenzia sp. EL_13]MBG6211390.1 iron-sulfur cluster assembly protein [Labrenzia sp. EL_126]MBG6231538.1 iron-sulfur cluster assembly protein [Labrenzia sp. EL_208]MCR906117
MASGGKFQVMTMTDAAAERVRELVENTDENAAGLRVGITKGGCAGMEYTMNLVEDAKPGDDVIEDKGAKLFVDPSAVLFLLGTEMDFEVTKFRSGFVFKNPNEVSACGCGESVSLQAADVNELAR